MSVSEPQVEVKEMDQNVTSIVNNDTEDQNAQGRKKRAPQTRSYNNQGRRGGRGRGRGRNRGRNNNHFTGTARELHVSGESPVKRVAGAIAWIAREGECPRILATQPPAINTACKAIAIARNYLRQDAIDIRAYPRFSPGRRRSDDSFTFILTKTELALRDVTRPTDDIVAVRLTTTGNGGGATGNTEERQKRGGASESNNENVIQTMKISKKSKPPTVAGAISARVREGQRVVLACIGPKSVAIAVRSLAIARSYLSEDGADISFRPRFRDIDFQDGRRSSSLQFHVLAQQI